MQYEIIKHYPSYNKRRYSKPWVCEITERGKYDFSKDIGAYTGREGESGDLMIYTPAQGIIYGYGQKDYRGGKNSEFGFVYWNGKRFIPCDAFGNEKEIEE